MERAHRASAVETLLARLSGEVAPLWITFAAVLDRPLEVERLRTALAALVAVTPRLQLAWVEAGARWRRVHRDEACLRDALRTSTDPQPAALLQAELISAPIELADELPVRLHQRALADGAGPVLLSLQLHHAIGDARALCRLAAQLWRLYREAASPGPWGGPWGGPVDPLPDSRVGQWLRATAPGWLRALGPAALLLAPRGASLPRDGDTIGPPILAARRLRLRAEPRRFGGILLAAVAAEAAQRARGERLRLRLPVDLAPALGLGEVLANTCIALPLELPRVELVRLSREPRALHGRCREALHTVVRRGGPQVALLECLVTARAASRETLRRNARPGLLAHPRTNTLVTTHVGSIDAAFAEMPAKILDAWGHTPTWGVSSIALGSEIFLQCTGFAGLTTPARLSELADAIAARARLLDQELAP